MMPPPQGSAGFIIALAGCAAVHAAVLFRPSRGVPQLNGASLSARQLSPDRVDDLRDLMIFT